MKIRLAVCLPLFLALAACASPGGFGGFGGGGAAETPIRQTTTDAGDEQLILDPVDAWDMRGAGEAELLTIDGRELYFRKRAKKPFEQAWVRLGAFWHSRMKKPVITVVVADPKPVKLQRLRVMAGGSEANARPEKDFNFTPGKRAFDKTLSSGVFAVSARLLRAIGEAEDAHVTIVTDRGGLRVNLSAVPDTSAGGLRGSAKFLLAEFAARQRELEKSL